MLDGKTWKNITTVILRIDYFWSIVSYSYHLVVVLSFFFFLSSFASSSSLSSAGVAVLVTRSCSFSSSCFNEIFRLYMRNISYPYFLFHGLLRSCRFNLLLVSLLPLMHCDYSAKSCMATIISVFVPIHQEDILGYYNNIIFHYC